MAQTDAAVLVAGTGHVWLGTVGTATKPTVAQLATFQSSGTVPATWTPLGHTDAEDVVAFEQEGGDTETLRSWQVTSLRTTTEAATDTFTIPSLQLRDRAVLELYYGGDGGAVADEFALPDTAVAAQRAVTVVFMDGASPFALYVPKTEITRGDALEFATDALTKVPLKFTILQASGNPKAVWIGADLDA